MEKSKVLLNFDVFGWFTAIIQIQIRVLCKNRKFLSPDQEEEHVSCPASPHVSVNLKKLKCERTCACVVCSVHARARGSQNVGKIVG